MNATTQQTNALILATASSYKRELLARLGIRFEAHAADVDESRLPGEDAQTMCTRLAVAKADAVAAQHPNAWVIGADQVVFYDDSILGKPGSRERAVEQLMTLQGRQHFLMSAVALIGPAGQTHVATSLTKMTMRPRTRAQIESYVDADQPFDCAGAYKVEQRGIALFETMHGDDYTNIIGLPLTRVVDLLEAEGLL
ncbi:MAG: nucleoside triphosphate pyrophosphatase [bacterium]